MKYCYKNWRFKCKVYYADKIGRNEKVIEEYIKNQIQEDIIYYQIRIKEYIYIHLRK